MKAEGSIYGIIELNMKNNFVDNPYYILSISVMTESQGLNPWRVYIGYKSDNFHVAIAACNLTFSDGILQIKDKADCVNIDMAKNSSQTSLRVSDVITNDAGKAFGEAILFDNDKFRYYFSVVRCLIDFEDKKLVDCS